MTKSFAFIIFGITSNLAQIKLIPALYDLAEKGLLPKDTHIVGVSRSPKTKLEISEYIEKVLRTENRHHKHAVNEQVIKNLLSHLTHVDGQLNDPQFYQKLKTHLYGLTRNDIAYNNRIFYLATYPELYQDILQNLKDSGLTNQSHGWIRLMIEKPIGHDCASAHRLNKLLLQYFDEDQIFRLDHYLGKETLQNILTFRFGNGIFEPLINKDYIDHIQITAAEDFGIGARGGYYDTVGALKDVGQNHLLQMLAFATMNAPIDYSNQSITKQRIEILSKIVPMPQRLVFGQYEGYTKEQNVTEKSTTDTFFALKTEIKNTRFKGVPIYIRAGKMLNRTVTEVSIIFKIPVNRLLSNLKGGLDPNVLTYRIQPNEGIVLRILTKKPGHRMEIDSDYMQFCYRQDPTTHYLPDAYERLLIDAILGDQTFFNDATEVEQEWKFIDPLTKTHTKPFIYQPGSWGPKEASALIQSDNREWLEPSTMFCRL